MAILLMALSLIAAESKSKGSPVWEVPIPLMWGEDEKQSEVFVVNLKPTWKVSQVVSVNNQSLKPSKESNLEQWRNLVQKMSVEDVVPRQAIPRIKEYGHIGIRYVKGLTSGHRPWCLGINELSFDRPPIAESYLIYDLVKSPTVTNPYYEGFVCCIPTIRCKAKTIELLQEQLLQQYSQYLAKMLQDEEDFPHRQMDIRPEQQGLNGAFIAWFVGATSEEKQLDRTQKEKVTKERPNSNQLLPAWYNWEGYAFGIDFVF
ncbi:MAG: hypothetical protein QM703_14305 [Gemmatales bacterium]